MCSYRPEFELRRVKFMFATGPAVNKPPSLLPTMHSHAKRTELAVQVKVWQGTSEGIRGIARKGRRAYTALLRLNSDGARVTRGWSGKSVS